MTLQPFTSNFADNSTEAGFQFTFFCDLCKEGYKTKFIESKTYKKAGLMRGLGRAIGDSEHERGEYLDPVFMADVGGVGNRAGWLNAGRPPPGQRPFRGPLTVDAPAGMATKS